MDHYSTPFWDTWLLMNGDFVVCLFGGNPYLSDLLLQQSSGVWWSGFLALFILFFWRSTFNWTADFEFEGCPVPDELPS